MDTPQGPTIMGIDVVMVASILAAVATLAVLVAIYAATTVRDPMGKRVKALNERREQLKAGIVASTSKRRKAITNKNEMADKVRGILSSLKMLQEEQVVKAQARLMQAGIRSKDLAFVVIFARFVMPVVLGGVHRSSSSTASTISRIGARSRNTAWSPAPSSSPTRRRICGSRTRSRSAPRRSARACPTRSTCSSSAPRPASPSTPPSPGSRASSAAPIPSSATNSL